MNVSELSKLFLSWAEKTLAPRTVDFYRLYLDRFAAAMGNILVDDLRAFHLLTFTSSWHPMQAVQRCFSWAADEAELIGRNPFSKLKRPPLGQRARILSPVQAAQVLRRSSPVFRAFVLAMRETIARPQEIRELTWEQIRVHPAGQLLQLALRAGQAAFYLHDFKGRKRRKDKTGVRIIPITPRLGRCLARIAQARPVMTGTIFLNARGVPWTRNALRLRMGKLRDVLGLGPDARGERIVCYTLRHTSATEACALGVRDRILADLMGHSNPRMTARYQHLQPEHLMNAMNDLAKKRKNPPPQVL